MPFSPAFERYPAVKRLMRARRHPITSHGIAVALVAAATLTAWAMGDSIFKVPFITFFPAIVLATLIGGLWPGVLATALSALAAWHFFLPAGDLGERESLVAAFIFVSAINVVVVALLNAAVEHVVAHEENLRILIESSPTGIVVVDNKGKIRLINSSTEKLFGYGRTELLGHSIEELIPAERATHHRALRAAFLAKPETRPMGAGLDLSGRRKDGTEFPIEVALNLVRSSGRTAVLATVIDITDRMKARQSEQMVIRELRHRTRNLFAVFQGIASQSLDEGKTPAEAKAVLNGRIKALADAFDALASSGWEGAPLSEIIARHFAGFSDRVIVTGCDITVGSSVAQQFALIVHELATNAVKYGALSRPGGHIVLDGKTKRGDGGSIFIFTWKESGGPPVPQPTRKGFGSMILLDLARQLARSVQLNFDPQGLNYELQIDLSAIEVPPEASVSAISGIVQQRHVAGVDPSSEMNAQARKPDAEALS
jgi:PAS domain S-box-containing protein